MTTKRPMLILNGKATRYEYMLGVHLMAFTQDMKIVEMVEIDGRAYYDVKVSQSTRPSGRRVIWVSMEVDG